MRGEIPEAVEHTIAAGSARVWTTWILEPPSARAPIAFEGVVDFARRRVRQTLIDAEPDGIEAETIFAEGACFFCFDGRWTRTPVRSVEGAPSPGDPRSGDPTWILDALRGPETTARVIGAEEVREVATTRYASVLDASPGARLRTDVWIDADGLIRRTATTRNRRRRIGWLHERLGWRRATMLMELWDFGLPVSVEVPDAELVPTGPRGLLRLWRETR